jgi:hypothetical protein
MNDISNRVSRTVEEPYLIARVAEFKTKVPIDQWPVCSTHCERVTIAEEGAPASWGVPGFTVRFIACCDPAVEQFLTIMNATLGLPRA